MGTLTTITAPTCEPVTLQELKDAIGVSHNDDDHELSDLIKHARELAEEYTNMRFMSQVVELSYDRWPASTIELGVWPIQSIDSVKYDDTASPVAEQTLVVNTDYYADTTTKGGRVAAISGWPSAACQPNPIRIRMTVGYASASAVPAAIRRGVILWAASIYQCPDYLRAAQECLRPYRFFNV